MSFKVNDFFQLECPECGWHQFTIQITDRFIMADCNDCGRTSYYKEIAKDQDIEKADSKSVSPENFDEVPF